jgi:hypothetical protein
MSIGVQIDFGDLTLNLTYAVCMTHREAGEGDLDVGVHEVTRLGPESVLQVRHQRRVHPAHAPGHDAAAKLLLNKLEKC